MVCKSQPWLKALHTQKDENKVAFDDREKYNFPILNKPASNTTSCLSTCAPMYASLRVLHLNLYSPSPLLPNVVGAYIALTFQMDGWHEQWKNTGDGALKGSAWEGLLSSIWPPRALLYFLPHLLDSQFTPWIHHWWMLGNRSLSPTGSWLGFHLCPHGFTILKCTKLFYFYLCLGPTFTSCKFLVNKRKDNVI